MSGTVGGGSGPLAILASPGKIQDKPKQLKEAFDAWVKFQPPYVEALSAGLFGCFQGAFLGTLMGSMTQNAAGEVGSGTPRPSNDNFLSSFKSRLIPSLGIRFTFPERLLLLQLCLVHL